MDGPYTKEQMEEWQREIDKGPPKWEELPVVVKVIKNDEVMLKAMLIYFKGKEETEYSNLMIRLISNELKDPRL